MIFILIHHIITIFLESLYVLIVSHIIRQIRKNTTAFAIFTNLYFFCDMSPHSVYKLFIDKPEFVPSKRGNRVIKYGPHRFREHSDNKRQPGLKKRWVCNKSYIGCRAFIITFEDNVIKHNNVHNH